MGRWSKEKWFSSVENDVPGAIVVDYHWHDFLGNVGVALIIGAYFMLQTERLTSRSLPYLLANGLGAALILVSLLGEFNLSAFLVESFWVAISLYGLFKQRHRYPARQKKKFD